MLKDFFDGILDLIYPAICIFCKKPIPPSCKKTQLCPACLDNILKNVPPFCKKCSRPLENPNRQFCKTCERESLDFDNAWGACCYDETMKRLLHLFKYGNKTGLRYLFCELILTYLTTYHIELSDMDFIVPVPLYPTRLRERGYNQAEILAQMISLNLNIPLSLNYVSRIRHTKNQAKLSQKERWTNIQGAFKIKYSQMFNNKNILIIDDLYTTGATTSEIAKLLKTAGAKKINVLTLAIAMQNSSPLN